MSEPIENMIVASLDQAYAAWVDQYDDYSPEQRGELAQLIIDAQQGEEIPQEWQGAVASLASVAFLEIPNRWQLRHQED